MEREGDIWFLEMEREGDIRPQAVRAHYLIEKCICFVVYIVLDNVII